MPLSGGRWQLYPLNFGEFLAIERSLFVFHKGFGQKIKAPCTGWLLDNQEEKILVDTGPWDPDAAKRYHNYDMVGTGPDSVRDALAKHELTPGEITTVLLTHLHWDHTANVGLFSNATFYVQRSEAFYALDPLPMHRLTYDHGLGFEPPWQKILHRTEFFDGDVEFRPGLTCHLLPGHTPGSQGILVHNSEGKYLIAGDNVDLQENWEGDQQFKHRPGGIFNNLSDYLESIARMEELADVVFPAHDYGIFNQEQYP
jgi:glyoxylase-like metal-dependent hydrolase (beta-lactamase superfamily II)